MKNFIKSNLLLIVIGIFFIIFSVLMPDISITVTGGFAWFSLMIDLIVGLALIWIGIVGGELTVESKGLIGWIKENKNRNK